MNSIKLLNDNFKKKSRSIVVHSGKLCGFGCK
jgi:hypothetical protein